MYSIGKRNFHIGSVILLVCAMACLVYYDIVGGLWLKGVTSLWFVLQGVVQLLHAGYEGLKKDRYLRCVMLGLILGMCADVLLGLWFFVGVVVFALGHVLYLIAFSMLRKPCRQDLLYAVPIAGISLFMVLGTPFIRINDPVMKVVLICYALIISCMLGKAISNALHRKTVFSWLVLVGAVLFWFSDLMLAIDMFGTPSRLVWVLCSYTYWPAQNILAYSLYHYVDSKAKEKGR